MPFFPCKKDYNVGVYIGVPLFRENTMSRFGASGGMRTSAVPSPSLAFGIYEYNTTTTKKAALAALQADLPWTILNMDCPSVQNPPPPSTMRSSKPLDYRPVFLSVLGDWEGANNGGKQHGIPQKP